MKSLIFFLFFYIGIIVTSNVYAQTIIAKVNELCLLVDQNKGEKEIVKDILKATKKNNVSEKIELYNALIRHAYLKKKINVTYDLYLKCIRLGRTESTLLEEPSALYFHENDPIKYKTLEKEVDSMFINHCKKNWKNANMEVAFTLRRLIRMDQRLKNKALNEKDTLNQKVLWKEIKVNDICTEVLLKTIFDDYGYPGKSMVGTESATAAILFLHMSSTFQINYINLLQKAVNERELNFDLKFTVDKLLSKVYKKSMYGNWLHQSTLITDPAEIKKYNELLNLDYIE
jgi:hypothetical protein